MGRISINKVNEAQVQAIVQAELAANPPGSQLPRYSSAPTTTVLGTKYYNTTDNKEYIYRSTGWAEMDTKDDIQLQDLSGNTIINE